MNLLLTLAKTPSQKINDSEKVAYDQLALLLAKADDRYRTGLLRKKRGETTLKCLNSLKEEREQISIDFARLKEERDETLKEQEDVSSRLRELNKSLARLQAEIADLQPWQHALSERVNENMLRMKDLYTRSTTVDEELKALWQHQRISERDLMQSFQERIDRALDLWLKLKVELAMARHL